MSNQPEGLMAALHRRSVSRASCLLTLTAIALVAGCGAAPDDSEDAGEETVSQEQALSTVFYREGETFQPGYYNYPIAVGYGWGAWNNAFLQLNWNGGPEYVYWNAPYTGWYRSRVRVAGSTCDGYPRVGVFIDAVSNLDQAIGPGWSHPVGNWVWLNAGPHSLGVGLQNDYSKPGVCDRNLWFDAAWIEAY